MTCATADHLQHLREKRSRLAARVEARPEDVGANAALEATERQILAAENRRLAQRVAAAEARARRAEMAARRARRTTP